MKTLNQSFEACVCSKMITNVPPGIMNNMKPSMTGVSIQRSVVAFPLRGRCNPYCCYLLPLLILAFIAFFLVLGALVASGSIPASIAFYTLNYNFQAARITAITVYSLVLFITGTIVTFYMCNMFNCCDSRYTPILLNIGILVSIGLLLPISVIMIVAEYVLPVTAFTTAVNKGDFLLAGVLGISAIGVLTVSLFFSRFYEFCIGYYKSQKRQVIEAAEFASRVTGSAVPAQGGQRTHEFYNI